MKALQDEEEKAQLKKEAKDESNKELNEDEEDDEEISENTVSEVEVSNILIFWKKKKTHLHVSRFLQLF